MTRRTFLASTIAAAALRGASGPREWRLGINTYCLRFERWNDRQLIDYCVKQKLDAIFLQDSLDPAVMDPSHWAEVRKSCLDLGLHLEAGGGALLPRPKENYSEWVPSLRKNIRGAAAMGSPIVR